MNIVCYNVFFGRKFKKYFNCCIYMLNDCVFKDIFYIYGLYEDYYYFISV